MVEGGLRIGFMSGIMWGSSVKMAADPMNTGLMTPAPGTTPLFIAIYSNLRNLARTT